MKRKFNKKLIFKLFIENNPDITQKDVQTITGKPMRTVAYWFSSNREIDDMSIVLLQYAVELSKRNAVREISRYKSALYRRAYEWAQKNMTDNERVTRIGAKKPTGIPPMKFIYKNKKMSIRGIANAEKITYQTCYARLKIRKKEIKNGDDVTKLVLRKNHVKVNEQEKTMKIMIEDRHTKINIADMDECDQREIIENGVDRIIRREYGSDYLSMGFYLPDRHSSIGPGNWVRCEVARVVGEMTEHNNEFVDIRSDEPKQLLCLI